MKGGASRWMAILLLCEEEYDMSATQFRDHLAIRYHHEPSGIPISFSQYHLMDVVHILACSMALTLVRVGWL